MVTAQLDDLQWDPSSLAVKIYLNKLQTVTHSGYGARLELDKSKSRQSADLEVNTPTKPGKYYIRAIIQGKLPEDRVISDQIEIEVAK